jgi:hypothetical protein
MTEPTYANYEQNFLADDFDEDDVDLEAYVEEPFDVETQIRLRYGFGVVNVTMTDELKALPLRSIIERYQEELSFRNINEISARTETEFVDQSLPAEVGTEFILAAVGDRKGR